MTTTEFEDLKDKIEDLKEKKAKAKGVMEEIEKNWNEKYGFFDLESAEKKEQELKNELNKLEKKRDNIMKRIEDIMKEKESDKESSKMHKWGLFDYKKT